MTWYTVEPRFLARDYPELACGEPPPMLGHDPDAPGIPLGEAIAILSRARLYADGLDAGTKTEEEEG